MKSRVIEFKEQVVASFNRGRQFVTRDIWRIGLPGEQVPNGLIIKQIRAVILLARGLIEETLLLRASALTFATLLFLVPFFAMMFYLIQTFSLGDQIYERMDEQLYRAVTALRRPLGNGPAEPGIAEGETDLFPEVASEPTEEESLEGEFSEGESLEGEFYEGESSEGEFSEGEPDMLPSDPDSSDQLLKEHLIGLVFPILTGGETVTDDPMYQNPVKLLVSIADEGARSPRTIGISGLLFILSTVFGFMRNVENTFNKIWGVERQRNLFRVIGHYIIITLLLPFVAAVIMGMSAALESQSVSEMLGPFTTAVRLLQFVVVCLSFTLVYFFVPNTKVYFRYALLGGVVGGSLYLLNAWMYVKFQYGLVRYTTFFSTFALFPLLLMYIYFSWLIMLFGSLVSFAYQNEKTFAMEQLSEDAPQAYREGLAVRLMLEMSRRYNLAMYPMSVKEVAESWNVPTRLLSDTLEALMEAKLVVACATMPITYQPARSTRNVKVLDVVNAIRESGQDPSMLRQDKDFQFLFQGLETAAPEIMNADVYALSRKFHVKPEEQA